MLNVSSQLFCTLDRQVKLLDESQQITNEVDIPVHFAHQWINKSKSLHTLRKS